MAMPTHIVAVGGIVEKEQGHVLLVKTQHGGWVFPGGQVEVGENLIDALISYTRLYMQARWWRIAYIRGNIRSSMVRKR